MNRETALLKVSKEIGVPPEWLSSLIQFESGWNPAARNKLSGARGLIQFMHFTAKALGYKDADDLYNKHKTDVSQLLGPVKKYFSMPGNRGPYPTPQSLYMTVFYPAARSWSPDKLFPEVVRRVNPGISYVRDYVAKVERRKIIAKSSPLILIALILGGYMVYKNLKPKGDVLKWTGIQHPQIYLGI